MKLKKSMRVLCCCRKGQVRSVAAAQILHEMGFEDILTCGLERVSEATFRKLLRWANAVLVIGSHQTYALLPEDHDKIEFVMVGHDVWGDFKNPNLQAKLRPLIKDLVDEHQ